MITDSTKRQTPLALRQTLATDRMSGGGWGAWGSSLVARAGEAVAQVAQAAAAPPANLPPGLRLVPQADSGAPPQLQLARGVLLAEWTAKGLRVFQVDPAGNVLGERMRPDLSFGGPHVSGRGPAGYAQALERISQGWGGARAAPRRADAPTGARALLQTVSTSDYSYLRSRRCRPAAPADAYRCLRRRGRGRWLAPCATAAAAGRGEEAGRSLGGRAAGCARRPRALVRLAGAVALLALFALSALSALSAPCAISAADAACWARHRRATARPSSRPVWSARGNRPGGGTVTMCCEGKKRWWSGRCSRVSCPAGRAAAAGGSSALESSCWSTRRRPSGCWCTTARSSGSPPS